MDVKTAFSHADLEESHIYHNLKVLSEEARRIWFVG